MIHEPVIPPTSHMACVYHFPATNTAMAEGGNTINKAESGKEFNNTAFPRKPIHLLIAAGTY